MGSFINAKRGWRWVEWALLICVAASYLFSLHCQETYKKAILRRRADYRGLSTSPQSLQTLSSLLGVVLFRPLHMLASEPIVLSFALYTALNFTILFGFLPAIPYLFSTIYHFTPAQTGLPFLGLALGCLLAIPTLILLDKYVYQPKDRAAVFQGLTGIRPEHRLYGALIGSLGLPISLFTFALTTRSDVHWLVPLLALIPFAWGNICIFVSCVMYMVDTYLAGNGASAMAANGLLRYPFRAVAPLFTVQMYQNLGPVMASSVFGILAVAMLPIPWILFFWGARIRKRSGYETWHFK